MEHAFGALHVDFFELALSADRPRGAPTTGGSAGSSDSKPRIRPQSHPDDALQ